MSTVGRGLPNKANAPPPTRIKREAGGTRSPIPFRMERISGVATFSSLSEAQTLPPDLGSVLICPKPIKRRAAQFLMSLCQSAQILFGVITKVEIQVSRKKVRQGLARRRKNSLQAKSGGVITLKRKPRRRFQQIGRRPRIDRELGMLQKEGNKRQAQARLVTLSKSRRQAGWLFVQGFALARFSHEKANTQRIQGACQLFAGDRGDCIHHPKLYRRQNEFRATTVGVGSLRCTRCRGVRRPVWWPRVPAACDPEIQVVKDTVRLRP